MLSSTENAVKKMYVFIAAIISQTIVVPLCFSCPYTIYVYTNIFVCVHVTY